MIEFLIVKSQNHTQSIWSCHPKMKYSSDLIRTTRTAMIWYVIITIGEIGVSSALKYRLFGKESIAVTIIIIIACIEIPILILIRLFRYRSRSAYGRTLCLLVVTMHFASLGIRFVGWP